MSLTTLNASGIRGFANDELEVLQACGFGQKLSAPHFVAVKTQIRQLKNAIKEEIKREVQGKMIAAMADSATLHNKSIFAISIQYIHEQKLKIRSIAMMTLSVSQTAQNLKVKILECLSA